MVCFHAIASSLFAVSTVDRDGSSIIKNKRCRNRENMLRKVAPFTHSSDRIGLMIFYVIVMIHWNSIFFVLDQL